MRKLANEELERLSVSEYKEAEKHPVAVVLDNIRSMNNVGSVFRSADAFRVSQVFLCGITARPPHRDIQKTALGATESVPWEYTQTTLEAITKLKKDGYKVWAIEQVDTSLDLRNFAPQAGEKHAFVLGNEVFGVEEEVVKACDGCLEIPQFGTKHSLNISVTAGIVLWDFIAKTKKVENQ